MTMREWWELVKDAGRGWSRHKAPRLAASLAFYTILSAAPLLVIALAIAGFVFGNRAAQGELIDQLRGVVGDQAGEAIQAMIASAGGSGSGVAMVVGVVLLLAGASGVFVELQDALNTVWEVDPAPGRGVLGLIHDRFLSLLMVIGVGLLLLATLAAGAALAALMRFAGMEAAGQAAHFLITFVVVTLLFGMMFKVLPGVSITWSDVWAGALGTSLLFTVGNILIGLYLAHAGVASPYGAAGSLVVFVVWVYYSGQVFFLGAEFTRAYANRLGSRSRP